MNTLPRTLAQFKSPFLLKHSHFIWPLLFCDPYPSNLLKIILKSYVYIICFIVTESILVGGRDHTFPFQFSASSSVLGTWYILNKNLLIDLVAQMVKHLSTMQETGVQSLGWEDPLERKWQPTPVLLPGKPHGQRSLVGYSPWSRKESDTTELFHFHFTYSNSTKTIFLNMLEYERK